MVPFRQQHPYKGEMVAFPNNSIDDESPPPVIKLSNKDFQEAKVWFCLDVHAVMDETTPPLKPSWSSWTIIT